MSNPRDKAVCKHGNEVSILPSFNYVRCVKCDEEAMIYPDTPRPPMSETIPYFSTGKFIDPDPSPMGQGTPCLPSRERLEYLQGQIGEWDIDNAHEVCRIAKEALDRAEKAERDLAQSREWRPIESAPRDGTKILGYWCQWYAICFCEDGVWFDMDDSHPELLNPPTHWMPLPPPPTTGSAP